ncbi:C-terminal binding protein [Marinobacter sp. JSM 1782161]|uniref:C-terminal binding protein n=1 Tax=Marinobacter sp. JSM 1782161 TaxID=2685906 RepID=UPI0014029499|nr:C-terminal binding protein [Marinobacter sp. JSM 1782161]
MQTPNVLIIDSVPENHFAEPDVERSVLAGCNIVHIQITHIEDIRPDLMRSADAVIIWATFDTLYFDKAVLSEFTNCKGIIKAAVGFDNIDIEAARQLNIPVFNTPDYGTEEVADHTMAILLSLSRKIAELNEHVRAGGWDWAVSKPIKRLRGCNLGIVGFGRIGQAVARRAQPFGLNVGFYDPYLPSGVEKSQGVLRFESLDDLARVSDIVSVNSSLNASSQNLINDATFQVMPDGVILINTARGAIINSDDLLQGIRQNKVAYAGLDVLESEPDIPDSFRSNPRVLLTPHSAFYSEESFLEMRTKSAQMALSLLSNKPTRNLVNSSRPIHLYTSEERL